MNNENRKTLCTWCKGKGYIKRDYDPTPIIKGRWIGLALVIIFFTILTLTGGASGWWSVLAILFLAGIFAAQFIADLAEEIGFWRGKKVVCPHCKGAVKNV